MADYIEMNAFATARLVKRLWTSFVCNNLFDEVGITEVQFTPVAVRPTG